jgi:hypothetical protein
MYNIRLNIKVPNVTIKKTKIINKKPKKINNNILIIISLITCLSITIILLRPQGYLSSLELDNFQLTSITSNAIDLSNLQVIENPIQLIEKPIQILDDVLGVDKIFVLDYESELVKYNLPGDYYPGIDYSTFQPYMCYTKITRKSSPSWKLLHDGLGYTDEYGFRRRRTNPDQFTIEGENDYVIALGNYYKPAGSLGQRFLIVTEGGKFTAIVGDEKADIHTDELNMFSRHGNRKQYAGMVEWIVDITSNNLPQSIIDSGTITKGPIEKFHGKILFIYRIYDFV